MYITVFEDGNFGFTLNPGGVQSVEISEGIHKEFIRQQQGNFNEGIPSKNLRLKNINGTSFDEIFEEFIPEPIPIQEPSELDLLRQENEEIKLVLDTILMELM